MGKIPDNFVSDVLGRTNIVDVISKYVQIQRSGSQYKGLCPFHNEKTPSFMVNPQKQFYYCFGCGAKGDAIQFLKEYRGLHFTEAVESLAESLGLQVPQIQDSPIVQEQMDTKKDCYLALSKATEFFEGELKNNPAAKHAIEYLKGRGLSGVIAKRFKLGFSPSPKTVLIQSMSKVGIPIQSLLHSGLCIENSPGVYSPRFRGRVMFPIRNRKGLVVGFGARALTNGQEPKYLNSPESIIFSKKHELYGLYEARQAMRNIDSLIVVEGYLDVIALHQHGICNAVATLGTSLTKEHLEILLANSNLLVFCFDGDAAGKNAAKRALQLSVPFMNDNRRVRFLLLPDNHDPDSYVREFGKDDFALQVTRSMSLSDYLFADASLGLSLDLTDDRLTLIHRIKPLLEELPQGGALKEMLYDRLAQMVGVDRAILEEGDASDKVRMFSNVKEKKIPKIPKILSPAYRALSILLRLPRLIDSLNVEHYKHLRMPGIQLFCEVANILKREKNLSFDEIRSNLPDQLATSFIENELKGLVGFLTEDGLEQEFNGALTQIDKFAKEQAMDDLLKQAKTGDLQPKEKEKLIELLSTKTQG